MEIIKHTDLAEHRAKEKAKEELQALRKAHHGKQVTLADLLERIKRIETILGISDNR